MNYVILISTSMTLPPHPPTPWVRMEICQISLYHLPPAFLFKLMKQKYDSAHRTSPLRRSIELKRGKDDFLNDNRKNSIGRRFPRNSCLILGTEIVRDQNNNVFLNSSDFPRLFKYLSATGNSVKVTDRDV